MPLTGLLVSKAAKILLNATVNDFGLPIGLWMVSGAHLQLCARYFEEFSPKMTDKYWISIPNNRLRHAMKFDYASNECFSHQFGCIRVGKGQKMCLFTQHVHNNKNWSFASWRGKTINEIHSDVIPNLTWNWKRLQKSCWRTTRKPEKTNRIIDGNTPLIVITNELNSVSKYVGIYRPYLRRIIHFVWKDATAWWRGVFSDDFTYGMTEGFKLR